MQLNPYLSFKGDCEAAFNFYAQHLGGKIDAMMPYAGSPMEVEVPADWHHKILHAHLTLDNWILMGSDCLPEQYEAPQGFSVSIQIQDPTKAEHLFQVLAKNGTVQLPIHETFWATRFGMLVDPFGIPWMINCDKTI